MTVEGGEDEGILPIWATSPFVISHSLIGVLLGDTELHFNAFSDSLI